MKLKSFLKKNEVIKEVVVKIKKEEIKYIGFLGCEHEEIIIYFASLLNAFGKKVLVCDSSINNLLYNYIPMIKGEELELFEYRGVDYYKGKKVEDYKNYDVVLINLSDSLDDKLSKLCSKIYVITSMKKNALTLAKDLINKINIEYYLIIKDYLECDFTERVLDSMLELSSTKLITKYILEFDTEDYLKMIMTQHKENVKVNKLSRQFREILLEMYTNCYDNVSKKEVSLAFKNMGRSIDK